MALFGTPTSRLHPSAISTSVDKDIEVPQPPGDSISCLAFSSQADYLAVGSWDNSVCIQAWNLGYSSSAVDLGSGL